MKLTIKSFAIFAAIMILLTACGNKAGEDVTQPSETVDVNIPQNTVAPLTEPQPETSPEITTSEPSDDTTASDETEEPVTSDEPNVSTPASVTTEDEEESEHVPEELNTRAMEYLKLFNSSKVHAKFVAAESYDGTEIFTTSVEYFIDGSERVYIRDNMKTIIRDGMVTVVDNDREVYFSYPEEGGYGLEFGFARDKYQLVSQTADEEVYEIEGRGITSTWSFRGDGSIRVADRASDGSFTLYDVELITSDVSMIDFTVPSGYMEVSAEDNEFYR